MVRPMPSRPRSRVGVSRVTVVGLAIAASAVLRESARGFLFAGQAAANSRLVSLREHRTQVAAGADTFDPWTALGIAPSATKEEARKAYKKLIGKYHPDIDPSPEAAVKFENIVRAQAVITGEDKDLDTATLLKNAVVNLRNDMEFKAQQIEKLKAQAAAEEQEMLKMQEQLQTAQEKRDKVTQELGGFGGAALGLLIGGPQGAVLGAVVGLAIKDREDGFGQIVRGTGTVVKGIVDAVTKTVSKEK